MDDLLDRLARLADPIQHAALVARQEQVLRDLAATQAAVEAMCADRLRYPSLPMIARELQRLNAAIVTLQYTVDRLEHECEGLRQRELLRLWETTD